MAGPLKSAVNRRVMAFFRLAQLLGGVLLLVLGFSQPAQGDLPRVGQKLPVSTYSMSDGLPSSHILDLDQDASGRLWILNRLGVTLYDGRSFEPYSEGLITTRLGALTVDEFGETWVAIGWGEPELYRLVENRWVLLPKLAESAFSDEPLFLEAIQGNTAGEILIALGNTEGELWLWTAKKNSTEAGAVSGPRWPKTTKPGAPIYAMERTRGRVAVAGEGGLCFLLPSEQLDCSPAERESRLALPIHALWEQRVDDSRSRLWLLGEQPTTQEIRPGAPQRQAETPPIWLGYLEHQELTVVVDSLHLPSLDLHPREAADYSMSMTLDAANGVYFGNAAALFYLDPSYSNAIELGAQHGLWEAGATALLTDKEGGVWVGRPGSLDRIGNRRFRSFDRDDGLLENEVTAIVEPTPGSLVLSHNEGVTFMEGDETTTLTFDRAAGAPRNAFRAFNMALDPEGMIWLATVEAGLLRLTPDRQVTVELSELPFPRAFARDPTGRLWVAGTDGLFVQTAAGFVLELRPEGLNNVRGFDIDSQGHFFVATEDGLLMHRDGEWSTAQPPSPEQGNLFSVLALRSGEVWVGSMAGPTQLRGDKLTPIKGFPQLAAPIFFLFQDPEDRVWLGTHDGVRIWDGSKLRHLSVRQGLAGPETNRGAGFVDQAGEVWVGTDLGVSTYRKLYDREIPAPGLELKEIEVDGQAYSMTQALTLGYRQNALTFRFKTISLSRESDLKVRWQLEGLEPTMGEPVLDTSLEVRYGHLAPGTYRFRAQAGWFDGVWGDEVASLPITIQQPFWRTTTFRILLILVILSLAFGAHLFSVRVMTHRAGELQVINDKLHQAATEREQLIASLEAQNLELERFNYTVSHDLKGPLVSILGFTGFVRQAIAEGYLQQATEDLARIDSAAERMTRLLKELFNLAHIGESVQRAQRVPLEELVHEAQGQLETEIARRGAVIKADLGEYAVWGDHERLRIMLRHLMDNAIKFNTSVPPTVTIDVQEEPTQLLIVVTDNGVGIPSEYREQVFGLFKRLDVSFSGTGVGLTLVARIAEAHGGKVWAEAGPRGQGSRFVVALPRRFEQKAA